MTTTRRALVTCPFVPITSILGSHRSALGVIYADMIKQSSKYDEVVIDWRAKTITNHNEFDDMFLYHGSDWNKVINLYNGVYGFLYLSNVINVSKFKGKVYSLGVQCPEYHTLLKRRLHSAEVKGTWVIQPGWYDVDMDNLGKMVESMQCVPFPHITDQVVIGDSHAICMYRPGWTVNSVKSKTLNGALTSGLSSFVEEIRPLNEVKYLECYFGNIDVRHHLCRLEGNHIHNAKELATRYFNAAKELTIPNIVLYELLPIENPSRKIHKTGFYKGKPFWGTWLERNAVRTEFNNTLENLCDSHPTITFKKWTNYLINASGELDFAYMETPKSIHLSREFYPYWTGQDSSIPIASQIRNSLDQFFS